METTEERWLPVPVDGFGHLYEVSDHGRVRSLDRTITGILSRGHLMTYDRPFPGRILKSRLAKNARHITVTLCRDGMEQTVTLHSLVLGAFVGPRPADMWGLHWDDNPSNNRLDNLRWGTPTDNAQDAIRNGFTRWSGKTHCIHGHEYTFENTRIRKTMVRGKLRVSRLCRTCHREAVKAAKRKARGGGGA